MASGSPYPDFARPYPEECREVRNRLSELHGMSSYAPGNSCPSIDPADSRDPAQVSALGCKCFLFPWHLRIVWKGRSGNC